MVNSIIFEYFQIKDIDFTSARGKKRKLDEMIDDDNNVQPVPKGKKIYRI